MRALSPIVSAIILIVAAIIGGTLVYQYFLNTMTTMISKPNIIVDEALAYTSLNRIFIRVSNMGMTPVKINALILYCDENSYTIPLEPVTLRPGKYVLLNTTLPTSLGECSRVYAAIMYTAPNFGKDATRPVEVVVLD